MTDTYTNTAITAALKERCGNLCELCASEMAGTAFAISPRNNDTIENEVALCSTCIAAMDDPASAPHWQCLAGSIWSTHASVQALSYRILHSIRDREWAAEIIDTVELDEAVVNWAMTAFEVQEVHRDSNGTALQAGDNVILTQVLNVKGTNLMAPKGTMVRRIRLVPGNTEQIEGKINDMTIVILTRYVRKS